MKIIIPTTQIVHIFQEGPSFVVKKIELPKEHKSIIVGKPYFTPTGSFWISDSNNPHSSKSIIRNMEIISHDEKETVNCSNFKEILEHNIGKLVKITKSRVLKNNVSNEFFGGIITEVKGNFCLLSNKHMKGTSDVLVDMDRITAVEGLDKKEELKLSYEKKVSTKKIKINYLPPSKDSKVPPAVTLTSLRSNLSCKASYRLFLNKESNKCNLRMEITLVNNLEDLEPVEFNFHFGRPSFRKDFRLQLSNNLFTYNKKFFGSYQQESYSEKPKPYSKSAKQINILRNDDDLFNTFLRKSRVSKKKEESCFYSCKGIRSEKNSRNMIPMFDFSTNFDKVYVCNIRESTASLTTKKIIRLRNTSKLSWTKGDVMITSNKSFYEGNAQFPFVGVGELAEIEIKREEKISVFYSEDVSKICQIKQGKSSMIGEVIIEGRIRIKNTKENDCVLILKYDFDGAISNSSNKNYKVEKKRIEDEQNPIRSYVKWEFKLEKKKTMVITFSYSKWANEAVFGKKLKNFRMRNYYKQQRMPQQAPQMNMKEIPRRLNKMVKKKKRMLNKKRSIPQPQMQMQQQMNSLDFFEEQQEMNEEEEIQRNDDDDLLDLFEINSNAK